MHQNSVLGHEQVIERFAQSLKSNRLANTWLMVGPDGIGKRLTTMWLAKCMLCEKTPANELVACEECSACQQVDALTHPDLLLVEKPADKNLIPVELFIGTREKRMRAGLCHDIAMKPFRGGRRIAIIDDADFLNQEGANCLLKTLEEPPAFAIIFLISSGEHRQLPTIRSRSQIVRFQPLPPEQIQEVLEKKALVPEGHSSRELAMACDGSLQLALKLADPETLDFRRDWLEQLATLDPGADDFFESIGTFVDAAGKDSAAKRLRLQLVADLASRFYRHVMMQLCEQPVVADETMARCVTIAAERWPGGDAETAARCVERCGEVAGQIRANANQALVIEAWLCDLGRLARGEITV